MQTVTLPHHVRVFEQVQDCAMLVPTNRAAQAGLVDIGQAKLMTYDHCQYVAVPVTAVDNGQHYWLLVVEMDVDPSTVPGVEAFEPFHSLRRRLH